VHVVEGVVHGRALVALSVLLKTETDLQDATIHVYTNIDGLPYWLQHRHRKVLCKVIDKLGPEIPIQAAEYDTAIVIRSTILITASRTHTKGIINDLNVEHHPRYLMGICISKHSGCVTIISIDTLHSHHTIS